MWLRYWNLKADPFLGPQQVFVPTAGHAEALARLVDTVENCGRLAVLRSKGGLGKTAVLARAIEEMKKQGRQVARVSSPVDGPEMMSRLAEGLGVRVPVGSARRVAWGLLGDAVRLHRWQKIHVVLVVDDAQGLIEDADREDLARLTHIDSHPSACLTVILAFREGDNPPSPTSDWQLAIRLSPLSCSETSLYVSTKIEVAGRSESPFSPKAVTRLYDLSGGNPRGIDRLATLALMAGAVQRPRADPGRCDRRRGSGMRGTWPGFFAA